MKAVKATGLVPIEFDVAWGRYQAGDTGGVRPADVAPIIAGKFGKMASIDKDTETVDVAEDEVLADLRQSVGKTKAEINRERQANVEIPDNWPELHHLVRLKIAAGINGAKVDSVELADAAIQDELVRRGQGVSRFGLGANASGNLANQRDGGPNIPPSNNAVASSALGAASAQAAAPPAKVPGPAPAKTDQGKA